MSKQQYKEIQMGPRRMKIPEHWEKTKLGELAEYQNGYGFSSSDWGDEGLPIIRIQNLTNSAGEETNHYDGELEDKYIIEEGDLLVSWSATLGVFKWDGPKAALNQHIFKVNSKDKVDEDFLYYLLDQNLDILERKIHGTTMKHITKSTFENTFVALPPLPEQRRIAEILSTVDEAIQQTDEIIETSKELKKGLMQDLLTKGIGHDDSKDARLGPKEIEIPEEWDNVMIGDHAEIIVPQRDKPKKFDGDVPWIRIEDLDGKYVAGSKSGKAVSEEHIEEMNLHPYPENTLMCSCSGNMGVCAITERRLISNQTFAGLVLNEDFDEEYLYYVLTSARKELQRLATGTTIAYLSRDEFETFRVPHPPLNEQREIAERLSVVDEKIRQEEEYREKLEELKKGLMQDLLTGQVRVSVDG